MKFKGNRLEHPWYLEGKQVKGLYIGKYPIKGIVMDSRVCFGGAIEHMVRLDTPLWIETDPYDPRVLICLQEHLNEEKNNLLEIL
jgi:hypothetical protein